MLLLPCLHTGHSCPCFNELFTYISLFEAILSDVKRREALAHRMKYGGRYLCWVGPLFNLNKAIHEENNFSIQRYSLISNTEELHLFYKLTLCYVRFIIGPLVPINFESFYTNLNVTEQHNFRCCYHDTNSL